MDAAPDICGGPPGRVLLVEPCATDLSDVRGCLERRGYRVARATDVSAAARRLQPEAIDVAIVDGGLGEGAVLAACDLFGGHAGLIVLIGREAPGLAWRRWRPGRTTA